MDWLSHIDALAPEGFALQELSAQARAASAAFARGAQLLRFATPLSPSPGMRDDEPKLVTDDAAEAVRCFTQKRQMTYRGQALEVTTSGPDAEGVRKLMHSVMARSSAEAYRDARRRHAFRLRPSF